MKIDSFYINDSTLRTFTLRGDIKRFDYEKLDWQTELYKSAFLIALTNYLDLKYGN